MKRVIRKRIIAMLVLGIVVLGQAFGGAISARAAAQRRHYRVQKRANRGALIGNTVGLNGRRRGLIQRRVLTIPTRRRLPRTPIRRRVATIPETSLRNRRQYRN
jgi:hypothetical protein